MAVCAAHYPSVPQTVHRHQRSQTLIIDHPHARFFSPVFISLFSFPRSSAIPPFRVDHQPNNAGSYGNSSLAWGSNIRRLRAFPQMKVHPFPWHLVRFNRFKLLCRHRNNSSSFVKYTKFHTERPPLNLMIYRRPPNFFSALQIRSPPTIISAP